MSVADEVRKSLESLSAKERQKALEELHSVMIDAMYQMEREGANDDIRCCPRCGCVEIVKKGKAKDGSQRCLCHGCGRIFGIRTGNVVDMSKLPAEKWMTYVQCFIDHLSLRACAERVGVSLPTSLFMRRRILEVIAKLNDVFTACAGG